jgi:hypothetical protein
VSFFTSSFFDIFTAFFILAFFYRFAKLRCTHSHLWKWQFVRRVRFDECELLGQLDSDWIYNHPEDAEFLQQQKLKSRILAGKREFIGDFSDRWLKIKALRVLGLEKFMEPGKVWTQESPEVLELLKRCKNKSIANLLGHPSKTKPIQCLGRLSLFCH